MSNEQRRPAAALEALLHAHEERMDSDLAPRARIASGVAPRHASGLRPAVHVPPVAPPPLDLVDDGWSHPEDAYDAQDEGEDVDETLLDGMSVPADLIAEARAMADPLGEPANVTAQMPAAPPPSRLDAILAAAPSPFDHLSSSSMGIDPRQLPTTRSGEPVPASRAVRRAFLATFVSDDPPAHKLVSVVLVSFFATLALSAFVAWAIYLIRH